MGKASIKALLRKISNQFQIIKYKILKVKRKPDN